MAIQALVQIICVVALSGLQGTCAITCYSCSDHPNSWLPFDPNCGTYYYTGSSTELDNTPGATCGIVVYNNGYVDRYLDHDLYSDGICLYGHEYTSCFCAGDYCNTNSYCSECGYPRPTPAPTTDVTTPTTTVPTPPTTAHSTRTTHQPTPSGSLTCYNCLDCPSVDHSTPVIEDETFWACVTTVFLSGKQVMRGGSFDKYIDGECVQQFDTFSCWCTSNFCNDKTFGQMQDIIESI